MIDEATEMVDDGMKKAIENLKKGFAQIRTGRAHPGVLEGVKVDYYGSPTALSQVASVTVQDASMLIVKPWEKQLLGDIERAIHEANLGLSPTNDGEQIRLPVPPPSEERRKEYVKLAKSRAEDAKIVIRNHRRDGNDMLKKAQKDKEITEDEEKAGLKIIQDKTDSYIKLIDDLLAAKEADILKV